MVFLASGDVAFIHGVTLPVDGGPSSDVTADEHPAVLLTFRSSVAPRRERRPDRTGRSSPGWDILEDSINTQH
jgi:hypothetical protein